MNFKGAYQAKRNGDIQTSVADVVSLVSEAIDGSGRFELANELQKLTNGTEAPLPAEMWGDLNSQMREIAADRLLNQGLNGANAQEALRQIANRIHAAELTLEAAESGIASVAARTTGEAGAAGGAKRCRLRKSLGKLFFYF